MIRIVERSDNTTNVVRPTLKKIEILKKDNPWFRANLSERVQQYLLQKLIQEPYQAQLSQGKNYSPKERKRRELASQIQGLIQQRLKEEQRAAETVHMISAPFLLSNWGGAATTTKKHGWFDRLNYVFDPTNKGTFEQSTLSDDHPGIILGNLAFDMLLPFAFTKTTTPRTLAKALNREIRNKEFKEILPGQIGWAPRQTLRGYHASENPALHKFDYWYPNYAVKEFNEPYGIYFTANLTKPTGGFLSDRPYVYQVEASFDKPMIQLGEVPKRFTRNEIERQAQSMGADGIIYDGIKDNQLENQQIVKILNPNTRVKVTPNSEKVDILYKPGYQLKILMKGSPLEKQVSKFGTINVENLRNYSKKGSLLELYVINKVLNEKFSGQNIVDYNKFKQEVQKNLVTYNKVKDPRYEEYGLRGLGYTTSESNALEHVAFNEETGDFEFVSEPDLNFVPEYIPNTYTFNSKDIPVGNSTHYDKNTLGHIRTFVNKSEPNILYILENQSDWAQKPLKLGPFTSTSSYLSDTEAYEIFIEGHRRLLNEMKSHPEDYIKGAAERLTLNIAYHEKVLNDMKNPKDLPLKKYLHDNYITKLLQEILKLASENKLTIIRYPTSETAAKIEGFYKVLPNASHASILKKYELFPKTFNKIFPKYQIKTVIDQKGNSWYEIQVPENYLKQQWPYKTGGKLRQRKQ